MPVIRKLCGRLRSESGFTTIVALGVLGITGLLVTGVFAAARGDLRLGQRDIDSKRAYYAARAGVQKFLFHLNQNSNHWQDCPEQTKIAVPGSSTEQFEYQPVPANGAPDCDPANPIPTMIDTPTGTFRMRFVGYSGSGTNEVKRALVAGFRRGTPIDYLWYTTFETLDPVTYPKPWGTTDYNLCGKYRRDPDPRPSQDFNNGFCSEINWINGDVVNGPMYTHDQFRICANSTGTPKFGRTNDRIESTSPGATTNPPGAPALYRGPGCSAFDPDDVLRTNTLVEGAQEISPPSNNTGLLTDAQDFGEVFEGVTTIVLSGNTATVTNDLNDDGVIQPGAPETRVLNTDAEQIIYVTNEADVGCSSAYNPYQVVYANTGGCGDVYVRSSGNYTSSLTIGSANDIIINGDVTTNLNGPAMLGLVANNFVRVQHAVSGRPTPGQHGNCDSAANTSPTHIDLDIHAAVLALNHSFIVDNYDCGNRLGDLTVYGAIAQKFRGTVGTGGNVTGYLKKYTYDDRLAVGQPPYMFNIADANWHIERETSCVVGGLDPAASC